MGAALPKRIVRRLLRGAGLVPASDVEHAKRTATARARSNAESSHERERVSAASQVRALQDQIEARREQDLADQGERATLRKALAYHWERLNHLEAIYGSHRERMPRQLEVAVAARPPEPPETRDDEAHLISVCPRYADALARWRDGAAAEDTRQLSVGGATWWLPATPGQNAEGKLSLCVPLDALAVSRQFAVGGVMLDIGAGFGQTSVPRALLGDFTRIYAAEAGDELYDCLVANVAASRVRGVVLPDHASIVDLDAWLTRMAVPRQAVRFVRVGPLCALAEILRAGVNLLPRRDVVWQLDLDPASSLVTLEGFSELAGVIATHFTHLKELGVYPAEEQRKASDAKRLFKRADGPRPSGLLLFNLR